MFQFIKKKIAFATKKQPKEEKDFPTEKESNIASDISFSLSKNIETIKNITGNSSDIVFREFMIGSANPVKAAIIFVDGLIDNLIVNENIIEPLMYRTKNLYLKEDIQDLSIEEIQQNMISVNEVQTATTLKESIDGFLNGDSLIIIDGFQTTLIVNTKGWAQRSVSEPATESVIRGPREGFTENLRTNTSLIRRKVKNPSLVTEAMTIGKQTNTSVCLVYIKDIANEELISEIKKRLSVIDTDSILETGYIEQYIEDAPFSIFSTIGYTEKPDVVAAKILEGRVAILVDGTPFALTAPLLFIENFQATEDYYSRPFYMSILRFIRLFAFLISILSPAVYVAMTTFHQELIPTKLLFSMVSAREGIPFPAILEAGIMLLIFEILREAGVRLPRPVGQTISIVGALVMGDAAVSAGLIGAPMVIIVAITALSNFAVPAQADATSILRILLLILSGFMGGFGISIGLLGIMIHLSSLYSFGFPYLSPLAPFHSHDIKDSFFRAPLWMMNTRPSGMSNKNKRRQGDFEPITLKNEFPENGENIKQEPTD